MVRIIGVLWCSTEEVEHKRKETTMTTATVKWDGTSFILWWIKVILCQSKSWNCSVWVLPFVCFSKGYMKTTELKFHKTLKNWARERTIWSFYISAFVKIAKYSDGLSRGMFKEQLGTLHYKNHRRKKKNMDQFTMAAATGFPVVIVKPGIQHLVGGVFGGVKWSFLDKRMELESDTWKLTGQK